MKIPECSVIQGFEYLTSIEKHNDHINKFYREMVELWAKNKLKINDKNKKILQMKS